MRKTLLTISMLLVCWMVSAQWSNDPEVGLRITPEEQGIYGSDFKVNKDGITYVHFNGPSGGSTVTYLQILDKNGVKLFPDEGKVISNERTLSFNMVNDMTMVDSDGNALLVVCDCRNAASDSQDLSYTVYKVSPTGELLWETGVDLDRGHAYAIEAKMTMTQLSDGSYLFAWQRTAGYTTEGKMIACIQVERLSSDGDFLWDEPLLIKSDSETYSYPYLVDAGNAQAILVYAKGSNQDIMARKIDFDGSSVWSEDTRVYRGGFPDIPLWIIVNVIPDPKGGVFVGWYDDRLFTRKESTFISYVKPDGSLAFPDGMEGLKVGHSDTFRGFSPDLIYSEKDDCVYVFWRETDSDTQSFQRLVMQKVAMSGELLWDPEGVEVLPLQKISTGYYSIREAEDGNFTTFYMTNQVYGHAKAYAVKYNSEGEALWGDKPFAFSTYECEKGHLTVSPLIGGDHWVTMWRDYRINSDNPNIYMQCVRTDATLGTGITQMISDSAINFSSSVTGKEVIFNLNLAKKENVDLSIYSTTGQMIASVYNGKMLSGKQQLVWDASGIPSGVYLATLHTSVGCKTTRILIK